MATASADLVVTGTIAEPIDDLRVRYIAASPPDYRVSFTGSALPFGNPESAFHSTPTVGVVSVSTSGGFQIPIRIPNSYYERCGIAIVPPTLFLSYNSGGQERRARVRVGKGVPFRTLDHPGPGLDHTRHRTSATFYRTPLPVRSQEDILWDSAYPCTDREPHDFWGLKPPL